MAFRTNKMPVLQEKSASGTVATFNTALAMPLASCNIAITATQSGSGTPSPQNIRSINGYSTIHIQNTCGINQWDEVVRNGYYDSNNHGVFVAHNNMIANVTPIKVMPSTTYYVKSSTYHIILSYYDAGMNFISQTGAIRNTTFTPPSNCAYVNLSNSWNSGATYNNDISINYPSTDTSYHAFVGQSITVQIGSTVYGGEYDARTGVLTVTHGYIEFDGTENWINIGGSYPQAFQIDTGITNAFQEAIPTQKANNITNLYPWSSSEVESYGIRWQVAGVQNGRLFVYDNNYSSNLAGFKQHLSDTHLQVVYLLKNPTTIQLPPCPIDTIANSVNNIWVDTGDIDLTYKDLDIAKRGNFREVFKLPS